MIRGYELDVLLMVQDALEQPDLKCMCGHRRLDHDDEAKACNGSSECLCRKFTSVDDHNRSVLDRCDGNPKTVEGHDGE